MSGDDPGSRSLCTGRDRQQRAAHRHGPASDAFLAWQRFAQETDTFPVGAIVNGGSTSDLGAEVIAAYDAPFPDDTYKAGARIFPTLVPTSPDDPASADNVAAWKVLETFDRPFLLTFSDQDAITRGADQVFLDKVPGTAGQPHTTIVGGGHFLQEDCGPELAGVLIDFIAATSRARPRPWSRRPAGRAYR